MTCEGGDLYSEGLKIGGFFSFEFGRLIFGGAYIRRGVFLEFYGILHQLRFNCCQVFSKMNTISQIRNCWQFCKMFFVMFISNSGSFCIIFFGIFIIRTKYS